jgi:diacylglycerol kinase family enzyme
MSTRVDGRTWAQGEMLFTSVLNTPTYGSGMPAVPHARLTDGRLNVISAGRFGRLGTLKMLPRLLWGRHLNDPRVQTSRFYELSVQASAVVPLAADGEAVGAAQHWRIRVRPGSLWIVSGAPAAL